MSEIIAPAVRTLDYGYQSANPIDYQRAGAALVEPITHAVEVGNDSKNRFLLQQIENAHADKLNQANNDRAMQLAQWQHRAALEQQQMRDDRMLKILKQKNGNTAVNTALDTLINHYGGEMPPGDHNAPDYLDKVSAALQARKPYMTTQDAKAYVSLQLQRNQKVAELGAAANNPQFKALLDTAASQTIDQARMQAQKYVMQNNPQVADLMAQGASFNDAVAKAGAFKDVNAALQGFHQQAQAAWLHQNGGLAGGAAEKLAVLKSDLAGIDERTKSIFTMQGANGRTVPKPTAADSLNLANEVLDGTTDTGKKFAKDWGFSEIIKPATTAGDGSSVTSPAQPQRQNLPNPVVAPAATGYDANGQPLNQAPLAKWWNAPGVTDSPAIVAGANAGLMTPEDVATARASQPGFWSGLNPFSTAGPVAQWGRAVGSLFNSNISTADGLIGRDARYSALPVPQRAVVAPPSMPPPQPQPQPQVVLPPIPNYPPAQMNPDGFTPAPTTYDEQIQMLQQPPAFAPMQYPYQSPVYY